VQGPGQVCTKRPGFSERRSSNGKHTYATTRSARILTSGIWADKYRQTSVRDGTVGTGRRRSSRDNRCGTGSEDGLPAPTAVTTPRGTRKHSPKIHRCEPIRLTLRTGLLAKCLGARFLKWARLLCKNLHIDAGLELRGTIRGTITRLRKAPLTDSGGDDICLMLDGRRGEKF
jgi:hypothetical protein